MDELELLKAKFEDVVVRSEKLGCACTRFLSPKEQFHLQNHVRLCHPDLVCHMDGGYPDAERKLMFVLLDWFDASYISKEDYYQLICIKGSGYSKLLHKDYMGCFRFAKCL